MECIGLQDLTADDKIRMTLTKNADPLAIYYCSDVPRKQYVPLASTANWFEYFTRLSTHDHGKLNMNRDLRCLSNIPEEQALVNSLRYSTNLISLHFTLIAALEAIIPDVGSRTSITLHIIGAAEIEFITLRAFQELLHFFPALTALNVSFVGLNVLGGKTSKGIQIPQSSDTHQCCAMCTKRGRKILFTTWKGAYHLYVKTELYKKPDLAAAFRAQFTTNDQVQWGPTIKYLARAPHPTLFIEVAYREIQQQMAVWRDLVAGIAKQPEINTWRGMSPSLTYEQAKPNEVWYLNGWWYIVKQR
jgi:splicing suppressor protein 51